MSPNQIASLVLYACCLTGITAWLTLTKQDLIPRRFLPVVMVGIRLGIVVAAFHVICETLQISVVGSLFVAGILSLAAFSYFAGHYLGMFFAVIWWAVFEFVFGFPSWKAMVLHPEAELPSPAEPLKSRIGQRGLTATALKPRGHIILADERFPAVSEGGDFIAADMPVVVLAARNGSLYVREASD